MKRLQCITGGAKRLGSDDELAEAIGILMQHFKQLMRPKVRCSGLRKSVTFRRVSAPWLKDRSLFFPSPRSFPLLSSPIIYLLHQSNLEDEDRGHGPFRSYPDVLFDPVIICNYSNGCKR